MKCHPTRAKALAHLAALQINVPEARGEKALSDVLNDLPGILQEARGKFMRRLVPALRVIYMEGARLGGMEPVRGLKQDPGEDPGVGNELNAALAEFGFLDPAAFELQLEQFISEYSSRWWEAFSEEVGDAVNRLLAEAIDKELSVREFMQLLRTRYGLATLQRIATTEMTRIMGEGARARYASSGIPQWQWQTVQDARVDPVCEELQDEIFSVFTPFEPAHPNCRCWPVPYSEEIEELVAWANQPITTES